MELTDEIVAAGDGRQLAALVAAAGMSPRDVEAVLRAQVPAIAARIHERAAADEAELDAIFDIVEAGEAEDYLEDPRALTSRAAVRDGEDILAHLFGSLEAARAEAGAPPGMAPELAARLMTWSAVLCVAAMSRRWRTEALPAMQAASSGGEGLLALLVRTIVTALLRALKSALLPRRRRSRAPYSRRYRRHRRKRRSRRTRRSRRRRRRDISILEDILGKALRGR